MRTVPGLVMWPAQLSTMPGIAAQGAAIEARANCRRKATVVLFGSGLRRISASADELCEGVEIFFIGNSAFG